MLPVVSMVWPYVPADAGCKLRATRAMGGRMHDARFIKVLSSHIPIPPSYLQFRSWSFGHALYYKVSFSRPVILHLASCIALTHQSPQNYGRSDEYEILR